MMKKILLGFLFLLGLHCSMQARTTTTSTLTLQKNIFELGNVSIDDCHFLRVDQMEPNTLDSLCHFGNFAIDPNHLMLTNEICPVTKYFDEETGCWIALPDTNGITAIHGDAGIYTDKKLLVNEINPVKLVVTEEDDDPVVVEDDEPCAFTAFSGDICIRNKRIMGKTNPIELNQFTSKAILRIYFANDTSDTSDPTIATGAFINLKFFGLGEEDEGEYSSFFDVFFDVDIFAGQGNNWDSGAYNGPVTKFGHSGSIVDFYVYTYAPESNIIDIIVNFGTEAVIDNIIGCFYYDICSKNIDHIECIDIISINPD